MIEIVNLSKVFDAGGKNEFVALNDINLTIAQNECIVLKGVSGSGKSTLLSILGAMSKPSNGAILVEKQNIVKLPDNKVSDFRLHTIGFIFQSYNLIDDLSVVENLMAPLACLSLSKEERIQRITRAKELANILNKDDTLAKDLSGGEKQRCAIARALINNPSIIIADEPTANLDKNNSLYLIETLKKLKALGKTIIIATHDAIFEETNLVDRLIKIEYGRITQ